MWKESVSVLNYSLISLFKKKFCTILPLSTKRKYALRDYSVEEARKIRKQCLSYPIPHKAKEVTFKIIYVDFARVT